MKTQKKMLILVGVLALAGNALAAGPEQKRTRDPRKALALTDAQKAQIETLRSEFRKAEIRRQADLRIARLELQELLRASTIDEKAVITKANQVADLQTAAFKARVEHRLSISKLLTPEQRMKNHEFRAFRNLRHRDRNRMGRMRRSAPHAGPWHDQGDGPETNDEEAPQPAESSS
jgi:Spy/CpxP family protein refolding chaperone